MIEKNRRFTNGYKVVIKDKQYPLIKTSQKSVYYVNNKGKEKRTSIENVESVIEPVIYEEKEKTNETPYYWGGHMPFPPDNCTYAKNIFEDDGIKWIDNLFCSSCKKRCQRRKEYEKNKTNQDLKNEFYKKLGIE